MDALQNRVDGLNELLIVNNDRLEGYQKAREETNDRDLKILFDQYALQSLDFKKQLIDDIGFMGGEVKDHTSTSGTIYRAWMDVRHALSNQDKKTVLRSCEYGEDVAKETYARVLGKSMPYPSQCQFRLENQYKELQQAHDSIKLLRDSL